MSLLRGVATALDLDEVPAHQSIVNLASSDRSKLVEDRAAACRLFVDAVNTLRERVDRKEKMLINYERDLARLSSVYL